MAASLSLADLMQKLSTVQYSIGSQHWVNVTHITDPGNFYVRPTAFRDYLPILKQHQGPADPTKLQLGSTVVFKSKTIKHHVRGQIRNITNENETTLYDLFSLDYGITEQAVDIKKLRKPLDECPVPSLVLHCQLADCQPKNNNSFDEEAIEAMVYYVGDERAKMIVQGKTGDKYIVQLINTCPEDIATMLALTDYTCLGYGNNVVSRMPVMDQPKLYYTYKKVKVGDTLNVRVQSGDSLKSFYVCEIEDHTQYIKELKNVKEYYHYEQDFLAGNFERGNAVAVFSDWYSRYERAVITDVIIPEKKAVAQLVDWGIKTNIYTDATRLKRMSKEYYFLRPAMAIYCTADEVQVRDNTFHRFLYPGHEFVITVKKVGYQLDTPSVVTISLPQK
ncbi:uncharacterized protein LOC133518898 [Cydia pomonella]|uniref:uncharacterized protein LOC133518898 n=1 Tax=Cydia pomonella TaxID=82600 RepID=UPI002ADE09EA|nr:uncharacterized protein LOC133518898 [Cydia pomonella]